MSKTRRLAAIDIGTVTTRLLIADVGDDGLVEIARSTDITHLGEGLSATGLLSDAAMQRVSDVIARYAATMREYGVEHFSAMATSASRDAENSAEFLQLLVAHGVTPLVIPGEREAQLRVREFVATACERPKCLMSLDRICLNTWVSFPRRCAPRRE